LKAPDGVGGDKSISAGLARTGAQAVGLIGLGAPEHFDERALWRDPCVLGIDLEQARPRRFFSTPPVRAEQCSVRFSCPTTSGWVESDRRLVVVREDRCREGSRGRQAELAQLVCQVRCTGCSCALRTELGAACDALVGSPERRRVSAPTAALLPHTLAVLGNPLIPGWQDNAPLAVLHEHPSWRDAEWRFNRRTGCACAL